MPADMAHFPHPPFPPSQIMDSYDTVCITNNAFANWSSGDAWLASYPERSPSVASERNTPASDAESFGYDGSGSSSDDRSQSTPEPLDHVALPVPFIGDFSEFD